MGSPTHCLGPEGMWGHGGGLSTDPRKPRVAVRTCPDPVLQLRLFYETGTYEEEKFFLQCVSHGAPWLKERILKPARQKQRVTYKGVPTGLSADFSKETAGEKGLERCI